MQEGLSLQVVGGGVRVRVEDHDDALAVGVGDGGEEMVVALWPRETR